MKNKKGLLGLIIFGLIFIIIAAVGILYFQIKTDGLKFATGNIVIKLDYDDSDKDTNTTLNITDSNLTIIEEINQTKEPLSIKKGNLSLVHNNS